MFRKLPAELQLLVWHYAVPDVTRFMGVIPVIVDFNVGHLRAILPPIYEYKDAYYRANSRYNEHTAEMTQGEEEEGEVWAHDSTRMKEERSFIMTLLHTCRASRTTTMEDFRLDIVFPGGDGAEWWSPPDDMIYFPPAYDRKENRAILYWLAQRREVEKSVLSSIRHMAFILSRDIATALEGGDDLGESAFYTEEGWLQNFPMLESLSLFIDPIGIVQAANQDIRESSGEILLFEPEDKPVHRHGHLHPYEIAKNISTNMERLVKAGRGNEVPLVECFVVGLRRSRKSRPKR